jgi:hypothetical protein
LGNAKLLGIVNQINHNGLKVRFRPDEYQIVENGSLALTFDYFIFLGTQYLNYFSGPNQELIILSSIDPFKANVQINISRKQKKKAEKTDAQ